MLPDIYSFILKYEIMKFLVVGCDCCNSNLFVARATYPRLMVWLQMHRQRRIWHGGTILFVESSAVTWADFAYPQTESDFESA